MTVKPISEVTRYQRVDARYRAILDVLYAEPDQCISNRLGHASDSLMKKMPLDTIKNRQGKAMMTRSGFALNLSEMERNGWIIRDINGKRTKAIAIVELPPDYTPPQAEPTREELQSFINEAAPIPGNETLDEEVTEMGGRPGRFAARIEKSIPGIVEDAVVAGLNGWFTKLALSMGFVQSTDPDSNYAEITEALQDAQGELILVQNALRDERRQGHQAREELNAMLRKQYASRDMSPVRPAEVEEAWRGLAIHALENGWTIHRTGGDHLMWRSPTGFRYFSSSTSSDYRAVRNARADMEKEGLPVQ